MGKHKYGGPFTTEEVEDVKAFLGILSVLLATGPAFLVDISVNGILSGSTKYTYMYDDNFTNTTYDASENYILYSSGCIIPLIVVIIIPAYLFLLRLIFYNYIPWLLIKRMGVGIAVLLISGICTLLMGVVNHDCISDEEIC